MNSEEIFIEPSVFEGKLTAPPSKPYTHRALAAALLSEGVSTIINPLFARDTNATKRACGLLGAKIMEEKGIVNLGGGSFETPRNVIDVENSGTTLRMFTAISSLTPGGYTVLTGDESIRRRPMQALLNSLRDLGVECWSSRLNGHAPVIVRGGGMKGGETRIPGNVSSQFVSALLYASTKSRNGATITVDGDAVSRPYIDATVKVLRLYGFEIYREDYSFFEVQGNQTGRACSFMVPGDFSSAALFMAGAHLTGGDVVINGIDLHLPQADAKIIQILQKLGSRVKVSSKSIRVIGADRRDGGGEFDLKDSPDLLPIVAVMAANSRSETIIRGVGHARFKESDRITSMAAELRKLGVTVEELNDGLKIIGKEKLQGGCLLDAHGDHRVFMALTILAASTERGCLVRGVNLADISYPGFLEDVKTLGAKFRKEGT